MFNVTVIKLKDIIKIIAIILIAYILGKFIFKNVQIKNKFNQSISINMNNIIKLGFDTESCIFECISEEADREILEDREADIKDTSTEKILSIGSNLFEIKESEQNVGQEAQNITEIENQSANTNSEETKEPEKQEIQEHYETQVVTQNPIAEKYNKEYNGVKIKNETSYEITDDMLNSNDLNINTKNIIIFHTHTCESYTQTENYKYELSRKL